MVWWYALININVLVDAADATATIAAAAELLLDKNIVRAVSFLAIVLVITEPVPLVLVVLVDNGVLALVVVVFSCCCRGRL